MNKNLEKAKQLEAEAKAIRRAEQNFWKEVDKRKSEVSERYSINTMSDNRLEEAASFYGITADELFDYIISERQINYYKNTHKLEG